MRDDPPFEPERLIEALERQGVEYLLIGGIATVLHGAVLGTVDVDVLCADSPSNREHLAAALTALSARVRGSENPPRTIAPSLLAGVRLITFETRFGDLDVIFEASGGFLFDELRERGVLMTFEGTPWRVVSLDDLIALKRAAGRPQDLHAVELLEALRALGDPAEG